MIRLKHLAQLSQRLAVATKSGIDDRTIWAREADHGPPRLRRALREIRDGVAAGESVDGAMARTGNFFPPLFRGMVAVGQQTGQMGDVLSRLASHYEHQLRLQRIFLAAIAWPAIQLAAATAVIGLLIWIMGNLGGIDLLGFGLMGTRGLLVYLLLVGGVVAAVALLVEAVRRGAFWARPIQRLALKIPVIGRCIRTISLARLTWAMQLTLNVEMDLRRLLPIVLQSTGNDYYISRTDQIVQQIGAGREIHEAFRLSGIFPDDFVHEVEVAERSGRLVESMGHLSQQYEEQAQAALSTLAVVAGFAVWGLVAAIIIFLIFRIFSFYVATIMDATRM
jgi:type II secretory pathway component PulF